MRPISWAYFLLTGLSLFGIAFFIIFRDQYYFGIIIHGSIRFNVAIFLACICTVSIWHPTNLRVWVTTACLCHVYLGFSSSRYGDSTSLWMFSVFALVAFLECHAKRSCIWGICCHS